MRFGKPVVRPTMMVAVLMMAVSLLGIVATQIVSAFVLDKYDAYGEVPIPGSGRLHLPAGQVNVSFHTRIIGSTDGRGLPVPPLQLTIMPPAGAEQPRLAESIGSTTTVNSDARVRVWTMQVVTEGDYDVKADGKVSAFISPRLAFGHRRSISGWNWGFIALFGVGLIGAAFAIVVKSRIRRTAWSAAAAEPTTRGDIPAAPTDSYAPTDQGVRIEQLKNITALRDCGALTEAEFQAEKRRILGGR